MKMDCTLCGEHVIISDPSDVQVATDLVSERVAEALKMMTSTIYEQVKKGRVVMTFTIQTRNQE